MRYIEHLWRSNYNYDKIDIVVVIGIKKMDLENFWTSPARVALSQIKVPELLPQ